VTVKRPIDDDDKREDGTYEEEDGSVTVIKTDSLGNRNKVNTKTDEEGKKTVTDLTIYAGGRRKVLVITTYNGEKIASVEKTEIENKEDGSKTEIITYDANLEDGNWKYIANEDPNGRMTEELTWKVKNEEGGYSEIKVLVNADGSTEIEIKKTSTNDDYTYSLEYYDANDKFLKGVEKTRTTDSDKKIVTETFGTIEANGRIETTIVIRNEKGVAVGFATNIKAPSGQETLKEYMIDAGEAAFIGGATADGLLEIPNEITIPNEKTLPVTVITSDSIAETTAKSVIVGEKVTKVKKDAFAGSGVTKITFKGSVTKKTFDKNSLKGAGTNKKGKGLEIVVQYSKDKKAVKKSRKRIGVPKASVSLAQ
jgi:hypothetical protein